MSTFKACVTYQRKDGSYNVKLRVTHNRETRRMSTPYNVEARYVTADLDITDPEILGLCEDLCYECRKICRDLGFTISRMSVAELIHVLLTKLKGDEGFRLDFCQYWSDQAAKMVPGTRKNYISALNAFRRFIGRDHFEVMQLTSRVVSNFKSFIEQEPSQRGSNRKKCSKSRSGSKTRGVSLYIGCMRSIYNRAKLEFNDEDVGVVPLSRSPFSKVKLVEPAPVKRAIPPAILQQLIDLPYRPLSHPGARRYNLAKDCFLLSFGLIGMNSADLYDCPRIESGVLVYYRRKTRTRRTDQAEMRVRIEPQVAALVEKYRDTGRRRQFRFHREYISSDAFNRAINRGLKTIAEELKLPALQYYAARHSWATVARSRNVNIEKDTVHEALNHTDPKMRVTDIYIERDWTVIWDANKKVLQRFNWPEL